MPRNVDYTSFDSLNLLLRARAVKTFIFWTIITTGVIVAMIALSAELALRYSQQEKVVITKINWANDFPSITLCNLNPYKKSIISALPAVAELIRVFHKPLTADERRTTKNVFGSVWDMDKYMSKPHGTPTAGSVVVLGTSAKMLASTPGPTKAFVTTTDRAPTDQPSETVIDTTGTTGTPAVPTDVVSSSTAVTSDRMTDRLTTDHMSSDHRLSTEETSQPTVKHQATTDQPTTSTAKPQPATDTPYLSYEHPKSATESTATESTRSTDEPHSSTALLIHTTVEVTSSSIPSTQNADKSTGPLTPGSTTTEEPFIWPSADPATPSQALTTTPIRRHEQTIDKTQTVFTGLYDPHRTPTSSMASSVSKPKNALESFLEHLRAKRSADEYSTDICHCDYSNQVNFGSTAKWTYVGYPNTQTTWDCAFTCCEHKNATLAMPEPEFFDFQVSTASYWIAMKCSGTADFSGTPIVYKDPSQWYWYPKPASNNDEANEKDLKSIYPAFSYKPCATLFAAVYIKPQALHYQFHGLETSTDQYSVLCTFPAEHSSTTSSLEADTPTTSITTSSVEISTSSPSSPSTSAASQAPTTIMQQQSTATSERSADEYTNGSCHCDYSNPFNFGSTAKWTYVGYPNTLTDFSSCPYTCCEHKNAVLAMPEPEFFYFPASTTSYWVAMQCYGTGGDVIGAQVIYEEPFHWDWFYKYDATYVQATANEIDVKGKYPSFAYVPCTSRLGYVLVKPQGSQYQFSYSTIPTTERYAVLCTFPSDHTSTTSSQTTDTLTIVSSSTSITTSSIASPDPSLSIASQTPPTNTIQQQSTASSKRSLDEYTNGSCHCDYSNPFNFGSTAQWKYVGYDNTMATLLCAYTCCEHKNGTMALPEREFFYFQASTSSYWVAMRCTGSLDLATHTFKDPSQWYWYAQATSSFDTANEIDLKSNYPQFAYTPCAAALGAAFVKPQGSYYQFSSSEVWKGSGLSTAQHAVLCTFPPDHTSTTRSQKTDTIALSTTSTSDSSITISTVSPSIPSSSPESTTPTTIHQQQSTVSSGFSSVPSTSLISLDFVDSSPELIATSPVDSSDQNDRPNATASPHVRTAIEKALNPEISSDQNAKSATTEDMLAYLVSMYPLDALKKAGFTKEETIVQCAYDRMRCSYENFTLHFDPGYGNCYTFDANSTLFSGMNGGFSAAYYVDADEYMDFIEAMGVRVVIHQRGGTIIPDTFGLNVANGFRTSVAVRRQLVLGKSTKVKPCVRDTNQVEQYLYSGSYTSVACYKSCHQKMVIQRCGCGDPRIPLPSNSTAKMCDIFARDCVNAFYGSFEDQCNCPPACHEESFEIATSKTRTSKTHLANHIQYYRISSNRTQQVDVSQLAIIDVYLDSLSVFEYSEMLHYDLMAFWTDWSSIMGLLSGGSIITIFEIVNVFLFFWRRKHP